MRISIITPSYNSGAFIDRTIRSVLGQRGDFDLEYLVMDGGSKDGTLDVLRRYDTRLQVVSEKDGGPADAIAKGMRNATGDIVAWLNADDVYCEGALQRVIEAFRRAPESGWLCGRCLNIDSRDRETRKLITLYKNWWLRRYSLRNLLILNCLCQPAVFFRRGLIEEVGCPDHECRIAFDYAYWMRIATRHDPLILDECLASFRVHPASLSNKNTKRQFREELQMAIKYNPGIPRIAALHRLHTWAILASYSILQFLSGRRS